ncbi:sensor domain-containing diguanylate cyclase [Polynucleobacter sp. MWH-Braz-FAM2G]|uniref:bifunctional diguanylate cyclase/phosphodiesterase n=1 Tax=Polynucleobacter sp. MWH-Braz-FAM2G TaxID=1855883 RepID=UPI001BFD38AC|nr:sensor domain-containing diguanylate cyclase [Polynucleobacter sp. MWH-Braz-FAM2G]QWD91311.1 GGDEF domain-containing protein [Polynucleobacter sp. MWH-Braz-FAM2G]
MVVLESYGVARRNLRIIKAIAIALAIVLVGNAFVSIYLLRKSSIEDRSAQLSNLTSILAEHTAQTIFSANTALESIFDAIEMAHIQTEMSYQKFASQKDLYELLKEKTSTNPVLDVSTFVASDGKVLNFSREYPPPNINLNDRDYFKYLSTHDDPAIFYSVPVQNKGTGKWVFYLAKRINGKNHEFLGVVLVGVSVEMISSFYKGVSSSLGDGTSIILYRSDNTLLTRWPLVTRQIGTVNSLGLIEQSLAHADLKNGVVFSSDPAFTNPDERGVTRMLSYKKVNGYPFIVGATLPESVYLSNWYKNAIGVLLATTLSLIALIIGTYYLIRSYSKGAEHYYRANHDILTGLPNRGLFFDRCSQAINQAKRNNTNLAILFIDLDNLKTVNDSYSHDAGDALLIEVANRLKSSVRISDTVGRIGGDEFVVLLLGSDTDAHVLQIAENIRQALMKPVKYEGVELASSASIGIALHPTHGEDVTELLRRADEAMYLAKSSGRNSIIFAG